MKFEMQGDKKVISNLRKFQKKYPQRMASALFKQANIVMTMSKRDYVPVDLGTLKSSGRVERPVIDRGSVSVALVYGGAASPYALAVHEHPSGFSPLSWAGGVTFSVGGPKYLEKPLLLKARTLAKDLAQDLKL